MPTVAERFNFEKVESDGQNFLLDIVKLCKVNCVQELTPEIVNKIGNKGDLNANFLQAMQLIERQVYKMTSGPTDSVGRPTDHFRTPTDSVGVRSDSDGLQKQSDATFTPF